MKPLGTYLSTFIANFSNEEYLKNTSLQKELYLKCYFVRSKVLSVTTMEKQETFQLTHTFSVLEG